LWKIQQALLLQPCVLVPHCPVSVQCASARASLRGNMKPKLVSYIVALLGQQAVLSCPLGNAQHAAHLIYIAVTPARLHNMLACIATCFEKLTSSCMSTLQAPGVNNLADQVVHTTPVLYPGAANTIRVQLFLVRRA
jgi:hypothetical protein